MVFRVLDATAFYAGIPFASNDSFMTSSMVYEEIQHIKTKQGVLEMLQQTNRLQIRDPSEKNMNNVTNASIKTGDNLTISKQDVSVIALALENNIELITDDFAVTNVAKQLNIRNSIHSKKTQEITSLKTLPSIVRKEWLRTTRPQWFPLPIPWFFQASPALQRNPRRPLQAIRVERLPQHRPIAPRKGSSSE